jgi:tetratricopeptide (TPR) repeat protein
MAERPIYRIFLSSPADVAAERDVAERIVRALAVELADRIDLRLVKWEQLEKRAELGSFQDGIERVATMSSCNLLLGILWTRIGVPLSQDLVQALPWDRITEKLGPWDPALPITGTGHEWLSGLAHMPEVEVKLFRKTAKPPAIDHEDDDQAEAALDQRRLAKAFWERLVKRQDGTFRFAYQSFASTADFARELDRELRLALARLVNLPGGGSGDAPIVTWRQGSPWRGLGVFEPEHAAVFCGRDRPREAILDLLRAQSTAGAAGRTFALVVGLSGSGKSSLVRAGVIPHLPSTAPGVDDGPVVTWRRAIVLPGDPAAGGDPHLALVRALTSQAFVGWKHGRADDRALAAEAASTPAVLDALIQAQLAHAATPQRLFLLIDQFEELVSAVPQAETRAAFIRLLDRLSASGVWVVATLRGDYYQAVLEVPCLAELKSGRSFDLLAPTAADVAEIILRPAQAAGLQFERGPDGRYLNQLIAEEFLAHGTSLPLLSFVLNRLFEVDRAGTHGATHGLLELSEYQALGRLAGGIANHVTTTLATLDPAAVQRLFPALVRVPADGTGDSKPVRRRTPLADLPNDPALTAVVQALVSARLLEQDGSAERGASISLTHEILLQPAQAEQPAAWPALATWTLEQKHLLRSRDRLAVQAAEWRATCTREPHHADSLLLGEGLPILDAQRVAAELVVDADTRAFVTTSSERLAQVRNQIDAERRRRQRMAYAIAAGGVLLAALASGGGLVAWRESDRAEREAERAVHEKDLAEQAKTSAEHSATQARQERAAAEELSSFMLFDLRDQLAPIGQLGLLLPVAEKSVAHYRERVAHDTVSADEWRGMAMALGNLGDIQRAQGAVGLATTTREESLAICQRLTSQDPTKAQWQGDLAVAWEKLGDSRKDLWDLSASTQAYAAALTVNQGLITREPTQLHWQRDRSITTSKVGDIHRERGDLTAASQAYDAALAISQRLAAQDPAQVRWQQDLAINHEKVGDLRHDQGDLAGAAQAYREDLRICQQLASRDPTNTLLQRDLAIASHKVGTIHLAQGDLDAADQAFGANLALCQRLVARDPSNTQWQRDLALAHESVGSVREQQGDPAGVAEAYAAELAIFQQLTAQDPSNTQWQWDASVAYNLVSGVRAAQHDLPGATQAATAARDIRHKLTEQDPSNAGWQRGLYISWCKLAALAKAQGQAELQRQAWEQARAVIQPLAAAHPDVAQYREDLQDAEQGLSTAATP